MLRPDDFLKGLVWFFQPLIQALDDEEALRSLFREFGYDLDRPSAANALEQISDELEPALEHLGTVLSGGVPDFSVAEEVFSSLESLTEIPAIQNLVTDATEFGQELFDYLVFRYLSTQLFPASALLKAVGVIVITPVKTSDPGGRDVDYDRVEMRWGRLADFIRDNGRWAREVYGWGATQAADGRVFDHASAIESLAHVAESTQLGLSRRRQLPAAEGDTFLANSGGVPVEEVHLPLYQANVDRVGDDGDPVFENEIGLRIVPSGDLSKPETLGLAVAPYATGSLVSRIVLSDTVTLDWTVAGAATGGPYLRLSPSGIQVVRGGAVDARFEFVLTYANDDGSPLLLAGEAGRTRLEADAILASVGGDLNGDFFVAGGLEGLRAVIDVSSDGFLATVLESSARPVELEVGDLLLGYRPGRGVYFEGGSSLAVAIPINRRLGPLSLYETRLQLDLSQRPSVTFDVTGEARIGPLYAYVEGLGLAAALVPAPSGEGLFGRSDLAFGVKLPTGYAIALETGPIEGGGMMAVRENEYRGALALHLDNLGFSAFAILNTKLPGGQRGFSFVASIFGEFTLPLGYGFFLTGLGGVIGLHRTINTQALREVLYEGRLDGLLFPTDPVGSAARILADMAAVFPARQGQYVFGPMAKIAWGQPTLVEGKIGVVLEVGGEIRLLILGALGSELPTKDTALVSLHLSFFGAIDFAARTISFDASLANSRVLTFPVSGEIAARTGWAPQMDHIMSFGGLHPAYPRPANFPDLKRLSIAFGTNNPRVTLTAYQALTTNSLQFGARADAYVKGPDVPFVGQVAAEGVLAFDALVIFDPFHFDARLGGHLALLVDGDVAAGLGFDLRLTGPNPFKIRGEVWATVFGIDVGFSVRHTWGERVSVEAPKVDPLVVLRAALGDGTTAEPVAPPGRVSGVVFAPIRDGQPRALDPLGGLRYVQRALPLGVRIDKLGEGRIVGPYRKFDLAAFDGPRALPTGRTELEFVRSHFWQQSDGERLRAPVFERHKAGLEIAGAALQVAAGTAVEATDEYEVVVIGKDEDGVRPARMVTMAPNRAWRARWGGAAHAAIATPLTVEGQAPEPAQPVRLRPTGYLTAGDVSMLVAEAAATGTPPAELGRILAEGSTTLSRAVEAVGDSLEGIRSSVAVDYLHLAAAEGGLRGR